jgi:hypothetical protein
MRSDLLAVLVACCVFGCWRDATAQALGESVQINRQSMQGVGTGIRPGFPAGVNGTQQTTGQVVILDADGPRTLPDCRCARQPVFSVSGRELASGTMVSITSASPDAVVYYTTDGWTPTEASTRYSGRIAITADTRLQAYAEEPQKLPSAIAEADYTVNGPAPPKPQTMPAAGGVLRKGTALRLVTGADVSSDTAQVGDRIRLLLDENVTSGDAIVAPKGTTVDATLTRVDRAGPNGKPGVLAFQVRALTAHGVTIPLMATLTLAATDAAAQEQHIENASLVHVAGALPHGEEAEIAPGMALTAYVGADTALRP